MESKGIKVDTFFMSALLFVCAKGKRITDAENIFWRDIPARNLTYSVATTNSLMYMYARLNRADDALKVYELAKGMGLKCTVVTYGVLIKALMRSNKKQLQDTAFEILRTLPDMGISPGIEVYNQFLEHYARTHDYRQAKNVLRLMSLAKPRAKPDAVSYGYLITCFADSKKPRSALTIFHQMRKRKIAPNGYTYMGVLKALAHMRDGISAVQVNRIHQFRQLLYTKSYCRNQASSNQSYFRIFLNRMRSYLCVCGL
jgi:pentatricopeptide repeat protein